MLLLELTPAEIAFLTAQPSANAGLEMRLTQRLVATMTARLRLPVRAHAHPVVASANARTVPGWQPDSTLATVWLTRRLGGRRVVGVAPFVPRTLLDTLDAMLAECWIEAPPSTLPTALAWKITAGDTQASLAVQLPHQLNDMTRWARGVIRHV